MSAPPSIRRRSAAHGTRTLPLLIAVDRHSDSATLSRQIYHGVRTALLEGRFAAGTRLPATRVLATDLGVSRTTVLLAYDRLAAEGYIAGRGGGGTRVLVDVRRSAVPYRGKTDRAAAPTPGATLSEFGAQMMAASDVVPASAPGDLRTPFKLGPPALDAFPVATWARLTARRWRRTPGELLAPDDGPGYAPLRAAIADYLLTARAVRCTADQIVVTAGAQQGIDLLGRLLLDPGDSVWMEEYGYAAARAAFAGVGARIVDLLVDEEGIDVDQGRRLAPGARLAYVASSCEPPLGVTMSLRRRLELLGWAEENHAWIIEDDYNGEFHYHGKPMPAMQGLEHPGARRVIYLRTFTKTLFPALRLGYAVLPSELVGAFTRARQIADRHSPTVEQAVLADFIAEGHFARHVRRLRDLHAERQQTFITLASAELGDLLQVHPAPAGMRLAGWLPPGVDDRRVVAEAARRGVIVEPLSRPRRNPQARHGLILGYLPFRAAETRRALAKLADAIRVVRRR